MTYSDLSPVHNCDSWPTPRSDPLRNTSIASLLSSISASSQSNLENSSRRVSKSPSFIDLVLKKSSRPLLNFNSQRSGSSTICWGAKEDASATTTTLRRGRCLSESDSCRIRIQREGTSSVKVANIDVVRRSSGLSRRGEDDAKTL